jgi:transcriptional regulator with XRE-family HTH domain
MTAKELTDIRAQLGWSQEKLAQATGVARNSIARQERGEMGI